jgi:hypothetical protein
MSDPPTTTRPIPPTEPTKRRWLLPAFVGVGAFVVGLLIGAAAGSGDDQPTAPPTEEAPPPEAPADDALSDEGWTLTNLDVSDGALGDFEAVGRVTNETGQAADAAIFSLSVLDAEGGVIATMDASVSNVDDGETVTAEFISSDPYQDGDWTYEFTVTGSS